MAKIAYRKEADEKVTLKIFQNLLKEASGQGITKLSCFMVNPSHFRAIFSQTDFYGEDFNPTYYRGSVVDEVEEEILGIPVEWSHSQDENTFYLVPEIKLTAPKGFEVAVAARDPYKTISSKQSTHDNLVKLQELTKEKTGAKLPLTTLLDMAVAEKLKSLQSAHTEADKGPEMLTADKLVKETTSINLTLDSSLLAGIAEWVKLLPRSDKS